MTTSPDYLHGARAIAAHLGVSPRRAFYLLENRMVPASKLGAAWVARASRIDAAIEAGEVVADSGAAA
jgi:hypothetical protein